MNNESPQANNILLWCPGALGGGRTFYDFSGYNRHGLIGNADSCRWDAGDISSGGVSFIASNSESYVNFGASTFLSTTEVTISLWYKKNDGTLRESGGFGLGVPNDEHRCGAHFPWSDGNVYFDFGGASNGNTRVTATGSFDWSSMAHWVFTAGPRGMEIWRNGILLASHGNAPTRTSNVADYRLGTHGYYGADLGKYEDFRIYGTQLSPHEILSIYDPQSRYDLYKERNTYPVNIGAVTGGANCANCAGFFTLLSSS